MKNLIILLLSLGLVLPAAAQVNINQGRATTTQEGLRQNVQNIRTEKKKEIEDARENLKKAAEVKRVELQNARENFKKAVETKRTELQNTVKVQKEELKTKLEKIKDERKKTAVERIDQNLTNLNARMTAHYTNVLDQISGVLTRVVSRADKAQANGKDVTSVRTAITDAQNAITAARAAIVAQAGKTYSMNISGDTTLKNDVGTARQTLRDDLKKVEDLVKAAREAVRKAVTSLAQIQGVDELKPVTSTAPTTQATTSTTSTSQ